MSPENAATQAETAVWALQVRAWPQPSAAGCGALAALHQTADYLRSAADALDPPDLLTYMPAVHLSPDIRHEVVAAV